MEHQQWRTDLPALQALALSQGGYFDRKDALAHGLGDDDIGHHVSTGRFERIAPGVYRLAIAPISPHDELLRVLVWSNYRGTVSHESALALYTLSDVLPAQVHLTVPPTFRRSRPPAVLHRAALGRDDVTVYDGLPVTTPARSIVDAASGGLGPELVHQAVHEALARALTTVDQLRASAQRRRYRHRRTVEPLIESAIIHAT